MARGEGKARKRRPLATTPEDVTALLLGVLVWDKQVLRVSGHTGRKDWGDDTPTGFS